MVLAHDLVEIDAGEIPMHMMKRSDNQGIQGEAGSRTDLWTIAGRSGTVVKSIMGGV